MTLGEAEYVLLVKVPKGPLQTFMFTKDDMDVLGHEIQFAKDKGRPFQVFIRHNLPETPPAS